MQALFSAIELLGRSAKAAADPQRLDKVVDLARRAIQQHEKSSLQVLELLTQQRGEPSAVDLNELLRETAHLLRSASSAKHVKVELNAEPDGMVKLHRAALQSVLIGLIGAAIDASPAGATLHLWLRRQERETVIQIGSHGGLGEIDTVDPAKPLPTSPFAMSSLLVWYVRQVLSENRATFEIANEPSPGAMKLIFND